MSLPANFTGAPKEQLHHHFRNVCLEFKKVIKNSKDINQLEEQMDRFLNVCKGMNWETKNSDVYRKNGPEKAVNRLLSDYKRYINELQINPENAIPQNLLESFSEVEDLI